MAGIPVSLADAIRASARAERDEIFVARAGEVVTFYPAEGTADVKPMVKHALRKASGEEVHDELPICSRVPVLFPRVGNFVLTMPLPVGTPALIVFRDVSHAEWDADGELSEAVWSARHDLSSPVALLGLYPDNMAMSEETADLTARAAGMVVGEHNGPCRIELVPGATDADDRIKLGADATEFVALANKVDAIVDAIVNATGPDIGAAIKTAVANAKTANGGSVAAAKTKAK